MSSRGMNVTIDGTTTLPMKRVCLSPSGSKVIWGRRIRPGYSTPRIRPTGRTCDGNFNHIKQLNSKR